MQLIDQLLKKNSPKIYTLKIYLYELAKIAYICNAHLCYYCILLAMLCKVDVFHIMIATDL